MGASLQYELCDTNRIAIKKCFERVLKSPIGTIIVWISDSGLKSSKTNLSGLMNKPFLPGIVHVDEGGLVIESKDTYGLDKRKVLCWRK